MANITMNGPYGGEITDLLTSKELNLSRSELAFDNDALNLYTPFIPNHGLFVVTRMPQIMLDNYNRLTTVCQRLLMGFVKSVDGFSNMTMESDNVQIGTEGNALRVDIRTTGISEDYTITLGTDFTGLPLTKFSRLWLFAVSNPYKGNRAYDKNATNLRWSQANHTMEAMIIIPNPSYNKVEDVAVLHNIMFNEAKFETLNFSTGEEGVAEWSMPIKAKMANPSGYHFVAAQSYLAGIRTIWAAREAELSKSVTGLDSILSAGKAG